MSNINFKILFRACWLVIFIVALQINVFCAEARISASADMREMTIGDIIKYTVLIGLPNDMQLKDSFAAEGKLGEFKIRDFRWSVEKGEAQNFQLNYYLSIFKTGEQDIPAYEIKCRVSPEDQWQTVKTKAITIKVQSVLVDEKNPVLKPLKPKIIIWRDYLPWMIFFVLFFGAVWAGWYYWQKKQKSVEKQVKVVAAHIIAYRELEELDRENLIARGLIEVYFERLSGCIRRYLENRFFLRAPLMSTEEFLQVVKASPVLNLAQRTALRNFLLLSDLVKFACYGSTSKEAQEAYAGARNFIDQTKQEENAQEAAKV